LGLPKRNLTANVLKIVEPRLLVIWLQVVTWN